MIVSGWDDGYMLHMESGDKVFNGYHHGSEQWADRALWLACPEKRVREGAIIVSMSMHTVRGTTYFSVVIDSPSFGG